MIELSKEFFFNFAISISGLWPQKKKFKLSKKNESKMVELSLRKNKIETEKYYLIFRDHPSFEVLIEKHKEKEKEKKQRKP